MTGRLTAGNDKLKKRLNEAIASNLVFHAYVFLSRHRESGEAFAKDFIKAILTHRSMDHMDDSTEAEAITFAKVDGDRHEDVIVIRKQGASTRIEQIRKMQSAIGIRPVGERHIVLIADGDLMGEAAQNALLKTLEEPPGDTVLIILSTNIENLLPTVRSRSIICTLDDEEDEISENISEAAVNVMTLAAQGAGYYRLKKAVADVGETGDDIGRLIDTAEEVCRGRLFGRDEKGVPFNREKTIEEIGALEEARNKLGRGMSPKYILKELLLKIGG